VYGINFYEHDPDDDTPTWPANLPMSRMGGNRLTAYNWENNASNAGSDYNFQNDGYLGGGDTPGEAVRMRVAGARAKGAGIIVTVPIIGYVARDKGQENVGTDPATLQQRLARYFVVSVPQKNAPFTMTPDPNDGYVYQDEFVNWLDKTFPGSTNADAAQPIFFSLDNEPDAWGGTHEEIQSNVNGQERLLTYDGFINTTIAYASAIKNVAPRSLVFGPVVATWTGATNLGRYPNPDPKYGTTFFLDVYLDRLRQAEQTSGHRLVDVLDIHWYPEVRVNGQRVTSDDAPQSDSMVNARMQVPRSLWDPTYDEKSWVTNATGGPMQLIPRLRKEVAAHYPGTKLAITEYFYGRGGDISGGIAQADVLGIFGREGLFAATLWANANVYAYGGSADKAYAYVIGAFRMFRDYDGQHHAFGDVGLKAVSSQPAATSVYASTDSAGHVVIVAINKTRKTQSATVSIAGTQGYSRGKAYVMSDGSPQPKAGPDLTMVSRNGFVYDMPPLSVSTLVLTP
jgi:hypothetical protein